MILNSPKEKTLSWKAGLKLLTTFKKNIRKYQVISFSPFVNCKQFSFTIYSFIHFNKLPAQLRLERAVLTRLSVRGDLRVEMNS